MGDEKLKKRDFILLGAVVTVGIILSFVFPHYSKLAIIRSVALTGFLLFLISISIDRRRKKKDEKSSGQEIIDKKASVGLTIVSILDCLWGFVLCFIFVVLQGAIFYALLGLFYIVSGSYFLTLSKKSREIFLWAAVPLSILASLHIFTLSSENMPSYYHTPINEGLGVIGITILLPLLINFYILTRPKVKAQFK